MKSKTLTTKIELCPQDTSLQMSISHFRNGKNNILLATNVIEEGFDVSSCNRVISFDPIFTVKSYTQLRGRARQKDSSFAMFSPLSQKLVYQRQLTLFDRNYKKMKFLSRNIICTQLPTEDQDLYVKRLIHPSFRIEIGSNYLFIYEFIFSRNCQ